MPSPFPGMDPYLEHPSMFGDLHDSMCIYMREAIQRELPSNYVAVIGERLFVETSDRFVEPDVYIRDRGGRHSAKASALIDRPVTQPILIEVDHDEQRETFIEIRTRQGSEERVITAIEILSISNKTPGAKGQDLYRRKQEEMRDAGINLIEIDLLRGGEHTTACPLEKLRRKAGPFDYHICMRLYGQLGDCLAYTNKLEQPLPTIAVPLLQADGSVNVNIQAVFDRCYDAGSYDRRIDYASAPPEPPLGAKQLKWVRGVIARHDAISGIARGLAQAARGEGRPAKDAMADIKRKEKRNKD